MTQGIVNRLRPVLVLLFMLWLIELINWLTGHALNQTFGLRPRDAVGLIGVPLMPALHGGFGHLISNSVPLAVLGSVGLLVAPRRFLPATVLIVLVSGLAVWVFARGGVVVGASGLVFGWFAYLVTAGVLERSIRAIAGAVIAVVFYGGLIWGVFPQQANVSWEAHLFGAIAGALSAWLLLRNGAEKVKT